MLQKAEQTAGLQDPGVFHFPAGRWVLRAQVIGAWLSREHAGVSPAQDLCNA
jgi:hypothetical protein